MDFIKSEPDRELLIISMTRGKANALNAVMVEELIGAFAGAGSSAGVRAVVLASGTPRFFSCGFDVAEVFHYDRERMSIFFGRFIDLYESILRFPKPVVAAVTGHAYAAGAVLALACDQRVVASGEFGFALNEVNLGVVLPAGMIRMAMRAVGVQDAWRMVVAGETLTPREALQTGLAFELAEPDTAIERAAVRARELAGRPPQTFGAIKRMYLETAGFGDAISDREWLAEFIQQWFSPEATERKDQLIRSLQR